MDVQRSLRRAQRRAQRLNVNGIETGKKHGLFLSLLMHSHTNIYFYHVLSATREAFWRKTFFLKAPLFLSCLVTAIAKNCWCSYLPDLLLNIEQLSMPAGGVITPLLVSWNVKLLREGTILSNLSILHYLCTCLQQTEPFFHSPGHWFSSILI